MSTAGPELEVLLACFQGRQRAARIRRALGGRITAGGEAILDEAVFRVSAKGKAQVYDPRRVVAGTLTPALTWGVFGWLASGGWSGLAIWAVLGALCGGLYAYYTEHLFTKSDLKRIGHRLPPDSSALLLFAHGTADTKALLADVAQFNPGTASIALVSGDLSAVVTSSAKPPPETPPASPRAVPSNRGTLVSMLVFRYPGADTAKRVNTGASKEPRHGVAIETELLLHASKTGTYHVTSPKQGVRANAWSDFVSWGLFGVVYGGIAGLAGNGSVLGFTKGAAVTGVAWALFGLVAGALYGLWAGRGISARRIKALGTLLPPDTSMVVAWAEGAVTGEAITPWSRPATGQLILKFNPVPAGALLEV